MVISLDTWIGPFLTIVYLGCGLRNGTIKETLTEGGSITVRKDSGLAGSPTT